MLTERTLDNIKGKINTTEQKYQKVVSIQTSLEVGEMSIMKALIPDNSETKEIQII